MVPEKFFLHGIAKVGQKGTNLKKNRADWITGAELHCTCKMALSMAPQAFISTIDNALYALRLKTGRLDGQTGFALRLPDVRLPGRPGFGQHSVVLLPPGFKSALPAEKQNGSRLKPAPICFGQTGFEPATPSPPDLYAKPLRHCPLLQ